MIARTPAHFSRAARNRRRELGMSQAELARRAAVSRKWIVDFEAGKATVELDLVMRAFSVLGMVVELGDSESLEVRPVSSSRVDLDELLYDHGR